MALRGQFSGKRVYLSEKGLERNKKYRVEVENLTTGEKTVSNRRTSGGQIRTSVSMNARGVVKSVVKDSNGGVVRSQLAVVTADIDCCIAKLVHDAINCTCKCDQCKEDLKLAEKIFLLIQSATYDATLGNEKSAQEKYNKAKSFCTERCACGC